MTWTTPATWVNGTIVTDTALNAQIRDNARYLKGLDGTVHIESPIELSEIATPAAATSGRGKLFVGNAAPNNGIFSSIDDAGTVSQMIPYAEGSWTPTFIGSGGGGSFTYSVQVGRYTRKGNTATIHMRMTINTFSSAPSGNLRVSGLPFAGASVTSIFYSLAVGYRNTGLNTIACALIPAGQSYIEFYDTSGAIIAASIMSAASYLTLSGTYQI